MNEKKLEPLLTGEFYFANFIHNLEALLQAEPLFPTSAQLSLLAMSLATPSLSPKYCSSLRSNVHSL